METKERRNGEGRGAGSSWRRCLRPARGECRGGRGVLLVLAVCEVETDGRRSASSGVLVEGQLCCGGDRAEEAWPRAQEGRRLRVGLGWNWIGRILSDDEDSPPRYELPDVPEGYVMDEETARDLLARKDRYDLKKLLAELKEKSLNPR
ncbi:hypothetical protein TRIUR3_33224 [Triticum urartu]|uniref:Uncharacterized protein n=1 Tax=Triticum urartu TaxID=4572 RepID=M8AKY2_TRIUA|nr:hypothetical protein TRIUR3_33224 [Triticum urartu]